ncbi:hypothetical protein Tco_1443301 [Tanacetum coccineum]
MADKEAKSTTREFATNDQANYYSRITSIKVNGKNAYELKGKFLDDLHNNAFSGTSGEDAVKHIEHFLKIVDPIDLPNVYQDKLRVVVFPILLVGDAWRWFDEIKGSITSWVDLTAKFFGKYYPPSRVNYWKLRSDEIEPTDEGCSDLEETNHDDEQEIVWTEPALVVHCCKPFNDKNGCSEWPTCSWREDGYCNGGNLLGAYIVGNSLHYQDYEWYEALEDSKLKEEALERSDHNEWEYENEHEDDERHELCGNETHELSVCTIRRFEIIKYLFEDDEEYVAVKEVEYDDLTSTSEDTCRAYQEIFRTMDEGWMDLAERKEFDNVGEVSMIWKFQSVGVLKPQDGCLTLSRSINLHGESTEQISGEFLILILFNSRF